MSCYQIEGTITDERQVWAVASQTTPNFFYRVVYQRDGHDEFISCTCKAVRLRNYRCKHMATVLSHVHAVQIRRLLREEVRR